MAKSQKKQKNNQQNDYLINNPIATNFTFDEQELSTDATVEVSGVNSYVEDAQNALNLEYQSQTGDYNSNLADILIAETAHKNFNKNETEPQTTTAEEVSKIMKTKKSANTKARKITTENITVAEDSEEVKPAEARDDDLNAEVNKYENELAGTRKKLQKYLEKFDNDYLTKIRQTDYYKQRLAYWKDYYAKRRKDAEVLDQTNNLARKEAMEQAGITENKDNAISNLANAINNIKPQEKANNNAKTTENVNTTETTTENVNQNEAKPENTEKFTFNIYDSVTEKLEKNIDSLKNQYGTDFKFTEQDEKNVNNIARADLFIEEIDKRIGKEQTVVSTKELSEKVNAYIKSLLLDSMQNVLKTERDDIRKLVKKVSATDKKSTAYLVERFNEKYALYSDALASFDNVVTKGRSESKRAAVQRQKSTDQFSLKPSLISANDMLVDSLRTTFVDNIADYMTGRIVSQIEKQNLQNTVVLTKTNVKDALNQIMLASNPDFVKLEEMVKQGAEGNIAKKQQEVLDLKEQIKSKTLTTEQVKQTRQEILDKQNQIEYDKLNAKYVLPKQNKLLAKGSVDFILANVISNEMSRIIYKNTADKLNEYNIDKEKSSEIANKIIRVLDKSKDAQLNFKVKEVKEVEKKEQKVEQVKEDKKVEQAKVEVDQKPVEEQQPEQKISRKQFIDERIEALEYLSSYAQLFREQTKENPPFNEFFTNEKEFIADEYTHWFSMIEGIRLQIEDLKKQGKEVPQEYIDFYNENYVPNHDGYNAKKLGKEVLKNKVIANHENYDNYNQSYDDFAIIVSNNDNINSIKNQQIKDAVENLKQIVQKINEFAFCRDHSIFWNGIASEYSKETGYDVFYEILQQKIKQEDLSHCANLLNNNIKYYNQQIDDLSKQAKEQLDVLVENKEKIKKFVEAIIKEKMQENASTESNDFYEHYFK